MSRKETACAEKKIRVHYNDLPLCCPPRDKAVWNAHPRVYLAIEATGEDVCPYCGTQFILDDE